MADRVHPDGWPRPSGYAHGMVARGTLLTVAGQLGTTPDGRLVGPDFVAQFEAAVGNVLAVVQAAGGKPQDLMAMTVFIVDRSAYLAARPALAAGWRARLGQHYPAMTVVQVSALLEPAALVEIQALAVLAP